jgi:hypothetical protein
MLNIGELGNPKEFKGITVCHTRHHWVLLEFGIENELIIYDSAPSKAVACDMIKLAQHLGRNSPQLRVSPQQRRGSNQCGLFVILNGLLRSHGLQPPTTQTVMELESLRKLWPNKDAMLEAGKKIYWPTWSHNPYIRARPRTEEPPCGGAESRTICVARKQQKRGGGQCNEAAVTLSDNHPLCRLHVMMENTGDKECSIHKGSRRCPHKAIRNLATCAFHTPEGNFITWLQEEEEKKLIQAEQDEMAKINEEAVIARLSLQGQRLNILAMNERKATAQSVLEALAATNDPDFESELFAMAEEDLLNYEHQVSTTQTQRPRTLADLRNHTATQGTRAHPLALAGWEKSTIANHQRALRSLLSDSAFPQLRHTPIVRGILETLNRKRTAKRWKWSTMLRHMASIQGALRNLTLTQGVAPVLLSQAQEWTAALKTVAAKARAERPRIPQPCTTTQIDEALRKERHRPTALLLAMTWICAGRTGDCRKLNKENVRMTEDGQITVTFTRGKTVNKRGPYSLHSTFPKKWRELLKLDDERRWVEELKNSDVEKTLSALRMVDRNLENRSLRRGALQTLAESGASEQTLMEFSGHTQVATLRRYLQWGSIGSEKIQRMTAAATALQPQGGDAEANPTSRARKDNRLPERWIQYLGAESPPQDELPGTNVEQNEEFPLSAKRVAASADLQAIQDLVAANNRELSNFVAETFRWLHDDSIYHHLKAGNIAPRRRRSTCRLSPEDIEIQINLEKYERFENTQTVTDWCRVFTVPEPSKKRRRHICEPLVNDWFTETPTVRFRTRKERERIIAEFAPDGVAICLDFASFYDQFLLCERVRKFFGIKTSLGDTTMRVLPMGFRPAAAVAQAATWAVLDFDMPHGVKTISYIDNIIVLAHDVKSCREAAEKIISRATKGGLVFNAVERNEKGELVCSNSFDFLGDHFELGTKTISQGEKTKDKIRQVQQYLRETRTINEMTNRELAAVIGLFIFGSININEANYYQFLRFYSRQASRIQKGTGKWDEPIGEMPAGARLEMLKWAEDLTRDEPRVIDLEELPFSDVIFTDASVEMWSAVHLYQGVLRVYADRWTEVDKTGVNMGSSVESEPAAVRKALCRCVQTTPTTSVVIYTDHENMIDAVNSRCAHSFSYWKTQQFIRALPYRVTLRYVKGEHNPADKFSRGETIVDADGEKRQAEAIHSAACENRVVGYGGPEWVPTARNPRRALACARQVLNVPG